MMPGNFVLVFQGTRRHILEHRQRNIYHSVNIISQEYWIIFLYVSLYEAKQQYW
jgi:hypothetical protein